ncbi:TPA: hypothetical protein ACGR6T_004735 [Klebsiella aerogenes]
MNEFKNLVDILIDFIVIASVSLCVISCSIIYCIDKFASSKRIIIVKDGENMENAFMKAFLKNNDKVRLTEITETMSYSSCCNTDYTTSGSPTSEEPTLFTDYETDYNTDYDNKLNNIEKEYNDIICIKTPEEREKIIMRIKERIESDNRSKL